MLEIMANVNQCQLSIQLSISTSINGVIVGLDVLIGVALRMDTYTRVTVRLQSKPTYRNHLLQLKICSKGFYKNF